LVAPISQISDFFVAQLDAERLAGSHVDRPRSGSESSTYGIGIAGWVVGRHVPVVAIDIAYEGNSISQVPLESRSRPDIAAKFPNAPNAELSGFFTQFNSLCLPPAFSFTLRAVLQDEARVNIAAFQGRRATLRSGFHPRLQPLMVTSGGRSDSGLVVQLLGTHPQVAAYRPHEREPRVASYWMGVLQALANPASYHSQIRPPVAIGTDTWWLGVDGPVPRPVEDEPIENWMGRTSVEELAAICQARIDATYLQIAAQQEQDAVYFVEKLGPSNGSSLITELYPAGREVILVHDFRDTVSSLFTNDGDNGIQAPARNRAKGEEFVRRLRGPVLRLVRHWQQRSGDAHLVRYEDLILQPAKTLEAILRYLRLDTDPATIDAMVTALETMVMERTRSTGADPRESIGRWRRDLIPELQEACDKALGFALREFGYSVGDAIERVDADAGTAASPS
jgi:hypothetical protein